MGQKFALDRIQEITDNQTDKAAAKLAGTYRALRRYRKNVGARPVMHFCS